MRNVKLNMLFVCAYLLYANPLDEGKLVELIIKWWEFPTGTHIRSIYCVILRANKSEIVFTANLFREQLQLYLLRPHTTG